MRFAVLSALIADKLTRYIFHSTYLFDSTEEIDKLTLDMADHDPQKAALFRRILNSVPTEGEDQHENARVKKVMDEVVGCFEPLFSIEQSNKMRNDLAELLRLAADLWKSLQKCKSYFAVEPRSPSQTGSAWISLVSGDDKKGFVEKSVVAPQNVVLVLFPRIIMIGHEGEKDIFPGVVLLKPETTAADDELSQLPPISPTLARSGTNRSTSGRRGTMDKKTEGGPFLVQNGSQ